MKNSVICLHVDDKPVKILLDRPIYKCLTKSVNSLLTITAHIKIELLDNFFHQKIRSSSPKYQLLHKYIVECATKVLRKRFVAPYIYFDKKTTKTEEIYLCFFIDSIQLE